jgi:hypothetical protein
MNISCTEERTRMEPTFLVEGKDCSFDAVYMVPGIRTVTTNTIRGMRAIPSIEDPYFDLSSPDVHNLLVRLSTEYESYINKVTTCVYISRP